jgi:hypothetical protein
MSIASSDYQPAMRKSRTDGTGGSAEMDISSALK